MKSYALLFRQLEVIQQGDALLLKVSSGKSANEDYRIAPQR
ncbi:hypothetical protein [Longitalea arenae]|nr:hypothetical protein [Longitalea arenae]